MKPGRPRRGAALLLGAGIVGAVSLPPAGAASPPPVVTWAPAHPAASPPALTYAAAAYDPDTVPPTVVLFGGLTPAGTLSADTWTWNGSTWTDHPAGSIDAPPARELASLAYDPDLHQMILFGGQGGGGLLLSDTWAWNGASWYQEKLPAAPPARAAASLSFEPSGRLVLFGGTGYLATPPPAPTTTIAGSGPFAEEKTLSDTWLWTGDAWSAVPGPAPPARSGAALAFDPALQQSVLFGGESNPADSPEPDPVGDTWLWNGTRWSPGPTKGPPARYGAVLVFDPHIDGLLVLDGGASTGALSDAWVLDSAGWHQAAVGGAVAPRVAPAAAFDAAAGNTVVFGGVAGGGGALADTELVTASPAAGGPPPATTTTTTSPSGPGRSRPTTTGPAPPTTAPGRPRAPSTTTRARPPLATAPTTTAPAPTAGPSLRASTSKARRGATVRLSGTGFAPGAVVAISFHSTPVEVGQVTADATGSFTTAVAVPRGAAPGPHHFMASGLAPDGVDVSLVTPVVVVAGGGLSTAAKLFLVALALLIPAAAWTGMGAASWWRRRSGAVTARASAPRSPS